MTTRKKRHRTTPARRIDDEEAADVIKGHVRALSVIAHQLALDTYPGLYNGRGREVEIIARKLRRQLPGLLLSVALEAEADVKRIRSRP